MLMLGLERVSNGLGSAFGFETETGISFWVGFCSIDTHRPRAMYNSCQLEHRFINSFQTNHSISSL